MKLLKNSRFLLIASMAIFGTIGLFVRNIDLSSGEIALFRALLAIILIGAYLLISKQKIPFNKIKKTRLISSFLFLNYYSARSIIAVFNSAIFSSFFKISCAAL